MQQYDVTGMSCAACSARVEKAVSGVPGVESCSVNLLTNSMAVDGTASVDQIINAVENVGYGASVKGAKTSEKDELADRETPVLIRRLIASLVLMLPLMYVSMGNMMWGWPVPEFMDGNHMAIGLYELVLSAAVMVINQKFFINGAKGLIHRSPNMDTLVAMGSGASFLWSLFVLFKMTVQAHHGDHAAMEKSMMDELYFESAAMILTLITVGKTLEARSKGKTTDALKSLMKLSPETALVERDGAEQLIPASEVRIGDIFLVKPGESIPVDGEVIEGSSAVNEAALTGESVPAEKTVGDRVYAACINTSGFMKCRATQVGEDTSLAKIIQMVSDAAATKAPIARLADKVSGIFVPAVICIAIVTLIIWLAVGQTVGYALARAISVLVISCPCALGLATPVAIMVGNGVGAKNGILFKTAISLEQTGKARIIALDKTGTVTRGEPAVTDIIPLIEGNEKRFLALACGLEKHSEHPLAKAVIAYGEKLGVTPEDTDGLEVLPGSGLTAQHDGKRLAGGDLKFISGLVSVPEEVVGRCGELSEQGKTPMLFAQGNDLLGVIAVADEVKPEAAQAVSELKAMGLQVVMITGDNERTAKAIGAQAGIDNVIAGVLPDEKERVVRLLKGQGAAAMVGDGINDAPALTAADTGIAIGAGTDVAIDAADVVLMKSRLSDVPAAIRLSRAVLRNIKENLFWAFIYNVIGIPLAAGAYIKLFGWELQPMFGAAAMSLSSFCVVTNALRLNLLKIHDSSRDRPLKDGLSELKLEGARQEKRTLTIEGMMCHHCENAVKKCLEAFPEVDSAIADFEKGTAVLYLNSPIIHGDEMKAAVAEEDYKITGGL